MSAKLTPASLDVDPHVAGRRGRVGALLDAQDLGAAVFWDDDDAHGGSLD